MREYDQIAAWYAAARDPTVGVPELSALIRRLPPRTDVLDLGCGDGVPVSRCLIQAGFRITALDSSREMIARYQANFPGVPARCARAQEARFAAASFGAVVAWGVLFHLSEAQQRAVIRKVSGWLKPGGWFLFTAGDIRGEREGTMNGVAFRYVSLGARGYRDALEGAGMHLRADHRDAWDNHVYVAEKAS